MENEIDIRNISDDMNNANTSALVQGSNSTTHLQQQPSSTGIYSRPSVGIPASAIVQPFNYNPPIHHAFFDAHQPIKNVQQPKQTQHAFKAPAPPSGLPRKTSLSAVRRNDSFLASMGRKTQDVSIPSTASSNLVVKRDRISQNDGSKTATDSGSPVVTLV